MRTIFFLIGFLFIVPIHTFCSILRVSSEYSTIQAAIDSAQNGDTILVANGIYDGASFNGIDSVILISEFGPDNCIIDCKNVASSMAFVLSGMDQKSIIDGFTIKNADVGIWAYGNSAPTIKNNIIDGCGVGVWGGSFASPTIAYNKIMNCTGGLGGGGGLYLKYSDALVTNNIIINNGSDKGAGIYCENSSPVIINNTIAGNSKNTEEGYGSGIYILNASPEIINNIIVFSNGTGIVSIGSGSSPAISYNDIYGNVGGNYLAGDTEESLTGIDLAGIDGNLSEDPRFFEGESTLTDTSPCVDSGTPDPGSYNIGETDFYSNPRIIDGNGDDIAIIDMGAVEFIGQDVTTEYISICQGEEYEGQMETGIYRRTLTSATGEDSIVITYLTVNPFYSFEEDVTICEGENYYGFTTPGQYLRELKTIDNCDSVYLINLSVRPADSCHLNFRVPSEYSSIQSAMDVAVPGDTVIVEDGTYSGEGNVDLRFMGKSIIVKAENGPANCIIDCEGEPGKHGFMIENGETKESVVKGFTIRNASTGIGINHSSPTIQNNIIENCGKGIVCDTGSDPLINSNLIRNCGGEGNGGGISVISSSGTVCNNIIHNNASSKGGGIYCFNGSPIIINNTLVENSGIEDQDDGDSIMLTCEYDEFQRIYECFVSLEEKTVSGGSIYLENSSPDIVNNIIAFSKDSQDSTEGNSILTHWYENDLMMRYNYEEGKLTSVSYYFGFKNCGDTATQVHLYGNQQSPSASLDTTFTVQSGECYWIETKSFVDDFGHYGGIDVYAVSGTSAIQIKVNINNVLFSGCMILYDTHIQSHGIEPLPGGAGIIEIGSNPSANILYNDFYGNNEGDYVFGETIESANAIALGDINGNISLDPLQDEETYELLEGSPCIDAGKPDIDKQLIGPTDYFGNYRILDGDEDGNSVVDIGASEMQKGFVETRENISICHGESYQGWTESGEYQRILTAYDGKDSIVTTLLTVTPVFNITENISICEGDSFNQWTEEGIYPVTYTTIWGCDSIVTTNLSLYPSFKPTFTVNGNSLMSNEIYTAYQWYDDGGKIDGATNREFTISRSGEYYLEAKGDHGCTYFSDSVYIMAVHSNQVQMVKFTYNIIPNPSKGIFDFRIDSNPPEKITLKLMNNLGQVLVIKNIRHPSTNQPETFNVSNLSPDIYHLVIITDRSRNTRKIVIQ